MAKQVLKPTDAGNPGIQLEIPFTDTNHKAYVPPKENTPTPKPNQQGTYQALRYTDKKT